MFKRNLKYKNSLGLGVIEIILAIAIMMIITPAVLKYSFKELYEVKYINIAKQLKQIEKALLNYASIEKKNWNNGSSGSLVKDVNDLFVHDYGLNDDISPDITNDMRVKYIKDETGAVNVFVVLTLDNLGLDEIAFKQTLLYAGDTVGFKEDNNAYSITGAWSEPFANISQNINSDRIVVIKIDDTNLENEYASSNYLYRNNQGGEDGNKMRVNLSLGGYSINNFGTIEAANLKSSSTETEQVSEIKFNVGKFEGDIDIFTSLILKGVLLFSPGTYVKTLKVEISDYSDGKSVLKEINVPNAVLENATFSDVSSFHANIIVEGIATLSNLVVNNLQLSVLTGYNGALTNLFIKPKEDTKLRMEIAASSVDDLSTQTITIKDGHIMSFDGKFNTANGIITIKSPYLFDGIIIHDACSNPVSKSNPSGCSNQTLSSININTFMGNFNNALKDLSNRIDKMVFYN
ncbi:hypothetical protein HDR59_02040 [bacterium]|nr:hypothetical protein [bacterium]